MTGSSGFGDGDRGLHDVALFRGPRTQPLEPAVGGQRRPDEHIVRTAATSELRARLEGREALGTARSVL